MGETGRSEMAGTASWIEIPGAEKENPGTETLATGVMTKTGAESWCMWDDRCIY